MTLSSTRGLVRVSKNPDCHLQAAMALEKVKEPDFYRSLMGQEYPGEYGERASARRRGSKFEANLHMNNAALLRKVLGPLVGMDPEEMTVRNFGEEVPGPPTTMRAMRLMRTRYILRDLAKGKIDWHVLIQPQLRILTGPGPNDYEYVSPDFMVFDPATRMYVPGEEKSFIARDNRAEPGDLDLTRRQAAAQILALEYEAGVQGIGDRVDHRGIFIVATPYGLFPAPPIVETLDAEVHEVSRAIRTLGEVRGILRDLRKNEEARLEDLADELRTHFQDSCFGSCILASRCEARFIGQARLFGDDLAALLGPQADVQRLRELIQGAEPESDRERELTVRLRDAVEALGHDLTGIEWRVA